MEGVVRECDELVIPMLRNNVFRLAVGTSVKVVEVFIRFRVNNILPWSIGKRI